MPTEPVGQHPDIPERALRPAERSEAGGKKMFWLVLDRVTTWGDLYGGQIPDSEVN